MHVCLFFLEFLRLFSLVILIVAKSAGWVVSVSSRCCVCSDMWIGIEHFDHFNLWIHGKWWNYEIDGVNNKFSELNLCSLCEGYFCEVLLQARGYELVMFPSKGKVPRRVMTLQEMDKGSVLTFAKTRGKSKDSSFEIQKCGVDSGYLFFDWYRRYRFHNSKSKFWICLHPLRKGKPCHWLFCLFCTPQFQVHCVRLTNMPSYLVIYTVRTF